MKEGNVTRDVGQRPDNVVNNRDETFEVLIDVVLEALRRLGTVLLRIVVPVCTTNMQLVMIGRDTFDLWSLWVGKWEIINKPYFVP